MEFLSINIENIFTNRWKDVIMKQIKDKIIKSVNIIAPANSKKDICCSKNIGKMVVPKVDRNFEYVNLAKLV